MSESSDEAMMVMEVMLDERIRAARCAYTDGDRGRVPK